MNKPIFYIVAFDVLLLFLGIICRFPIGYYTLLRIVTCGTLAYSAYLSENKVILGILVLFAIVYNPFIPIHLGAKEAWVFLNILTILLLAISFILIHNKK